jgi:propionyl-CoA carboxylase alpha chain/3-methylcrotonyl-CoA carboxylase alpha subunit
MLTSVLIANRGEIARRIIRTARRLGVRTIAVYSQADASAPHVLEADAAVLIGPSAARDSYLVPEKILAAARESGAQAIHPGYGFLSENAAFAQAVLDAGLVWVGPPPAAISAMGLKDAAKARMQAAGVAVTPGYMGDDQSLDRLAREAEATGWPVLIKAVAGGGGKGMRKVEAAADFEAALASCRREALAAFGDDRVLIEKYVTRPRHIEVQVFADAQGHAVHLFERDCSLQRRHQKVIEEAPAPGMDEDTRAAVCGAAVRAALAVGYVGAGTVEFIADGSEGLRPDRIWFMEMNTRLQVEHPVTEMITGLDLVEWQLRVASGEALPLKQDQIAQCGHAIEARLYAENPAAGFLPSTGPLTHFRLPVEDLRIDSAVEEGGEVTVFYDPMIAKLIAHGPTRHAAAAALARACRKVEVWPVRTNAAFLARCLDHDDFRSGQIDTGFIEGHLDSLIGDEAPSQAVLVAAASALARAAQPAGASPWSQAIGFRLNGAPRIEAHLAEGSHRHAVQLQDIKAGPLSVRHLDDQVLVFEDGAAFALSPWTSHRGDGPISSDGAILSPMPGRIVAVMVKDGDHVERGQPLVTLEAMKMEHVLIAPFDGTVGGLTVTLGDQVSEGIVLVQLAPVLELA